MDPSDEPSNPNPEGCWTRTASGDLTWWPAGRTPDPDETPIDPPTFSGPEPRADGIWDRARAEYLAGDSARAICDRYGLAISTFRDRAARHRWRHCDQETPEAWLPDAGPDAGPDVEASPPDYADMAARALRQADQAIARGRATEASSWMRLHARLIALMPVAPASPEPPAPPPPPPPYRPAPEIDFAERTARAALDLARMLGQADPDDPIARAAVDARFAELMQEAGLDDPDSPDSFFSGPESGSAPDASSGDPDPP